MAIARDTGEGKVPSSKSDNSAKSFSNTWANHDYHDELGSGDQLYFLAKKALEEGKISGADYNEILDSIMYPDYPSRAAGYKKIMSLVEDGEGYIPAILKVLGEDAKNSPVLQEIADDIEKVTGKNPMNFLTDSSSSDSSSIVGSGGAGGSSNVNVSIGDLGPSDESYQKLYDLISETTAANNEWSAKQAQLNRDWQERMSSTAHQREVADLQAAGLNPVLSASGGSGASTPSGSVAESDFSNTRLLAEVAMSAMSAMSNTAVGVARASYNNNSDASILGRLFNSYNSNKLTKKLVDTGLGIGSKIASAWLWKQIF